MKRLVPILATVFILALAINVAVFAWVINPDHLQGDQWRWMREVVLPYRAGEKSLFEALTYEFSILSHTHILTLGEMLLNDQLFGLNLRLSSTIGILSLFGCFGLYYRYGSQKMKTTTVAPNWQMHHQIWLWGGLVVVAAATFATGPYAAYTWALVTFEHLYLFMALCLLFAFPTLFTNGRLPALISLMAFVFILGDAMGSAAILATLVMALLLTMNEKTLWKTALVYVASFVAIAILAKLLLSGQVKHSSASGSEALIYALTHPAKTLDFLFTGIGRGTISAHKNVVFKGIIIRDLSQYIGFALFLTSVALSFWALLKRRLVENAVPLLLIGFTVISLIGAIRLRIVTADVEYIFGDRYYRFLVPFFLGTMLLAYDAWSQRPTRVGTVLFSGIALSHVVLMVFITSYTWTKITPSIHNYFERWDTALLEYGIDGNIEYEAQNRRCRNNYCADAIDYLRAEEFSTFRTSNPPPGKRD